MTSEPDCHPDSLRSKGWSQGCQLTLALPHDYILMVDGEPKASNGQHERWMIADQDCDLAWKAKPGESHLVELRAVYLESPPVEWGVRNAKYLLDKTGAHLRANTPSVHIDPEVLSLAEHLTCALPDAGRRLKTWLGLRYDRPAVPQEFVRTADKIADLLRAKKNRLGGVNIRDILATFETAHDGKAECELIAVVPRSHATPEAIEQTRTWLASIALDLPEEFGFIANLHVVPDSNVSLASLETSFSLGAAPVSWPRSEPGPTGVV